MFSLHHIGLDSQSRTFTNSEHVQPSPKLGLHLLLKIDQLELDGDEDVAPVGGVSMVLASVSIGIGPVHIMQGLPGLALRHLRILREIAANSVVKT